MSRIKAAAALVAGLAAAGAEGAVMPDGVAPWTVCRDVTYREALAAAAATPLERDDLGPELLGPWIGSRPRGALAGLRAGLEAQRALDRAASLRARPARPSPAPVPIPGLEWIFGMVIGAGGFACWRAAR